MGAGRQLRAGQAPRGGGLADGGLQGGRGDRDAAGLGVGAFLGVCRPAWGRLLRVRLSRPPGVSTSALTVLLRLWGPQGALSPQSLLEAPPEPPALSFLLLKSQIFCYLRCF